MVGHATGGWLLARVEAAGAHAALVDAAAVSGAGVVRCAADGYALSARVAPGARGAVAHGLVAHALAHGLLAARLVVGAAHGGALPVATGVRRGAVVVAVAADFVAANLWVSLVAALARAHRVVLDDVTDGVGAAHARVFAEAVEARLVGGALRVGRAAGLDGRQQVAAATLFDDHAVGTHAKHGPDRQCVDHLADGGVVARVQHRTWVDAALVDAGELALAVAVDAALGFHDGDALHLGVSCGAGRAAAAGLVLVVDAFGGGRAGVFVCTGADALVVDAAAVARALGVSPAADDQTLGVAIALKA